MSPAILTIIIFFLCILSFIWEKIPLAVTCLLGGIALALLGIIDYVDIYSNMGTQVVAIVIGTSMVGLGLESAGISDMVGSALRRTGIAKNERLFITIIVLVTALLSAFLSNSAVIAMFIPIIQGMSKKSQGIVKQKHALLAAGLGSAAGGGLTLVGTAPIVTASSIVENSGLPGTRAFTFLEVGYSMLPVVILMALYFATFGYNLQQRVLADLPDNPLDTLMSGETEQASTAVPVWKKAVALAAALFMVVGFAFNLAGMWRYSLEGRPPGHGLEYRPCPGLFRSPGCRPERIRRGCDDCAGYCQSLWRRRRKSRSAAVCLCGCGRCLDQFHGQCRPGHCHDPHFTGGGPDLWR